MAVNTLLYSWMKGGEFLPSTPSRLKYVVGNASLWLVKNLRKMKAYNVVFSGSVKSAQVGISLAIAEPDPLLPFTRYAGRKGSAMAMAWHTAIEPAVLHLSSTGRPRRKLDSTP